ncbi:hypothetical protein ACE199_04080 [Peribacillus sp. Hz7]
MFYRSKLDIHLSEHVTQLMRFQQSLTTNHKPIFVMGNPNIPRIKDKLAKITQGLNNLEIIKMWVNKSGNVFWEGSEKLSR